MKVGTFSVNWVTNNIDPREGDGGGGGGDGGSADGGGGGGGGDSDRFESRLHAETVPPILRFFDNLYILPRVAPVICAAMPLANTSPFKQRFSRTLDIDRLLHER